MIKIPPTRNAASPEEHLQSEVSRKARRKLQRQQEQERTAWFWVGMFGLVGWSVAIPTIIGVMLGLWMDRQWTSTVSWTLTMLFLGIVVGSLNAWFWITQESRKEHEHEHEHEHD